MDFMGSKGAFERILRTRERFHGGIPFLVLNDSSLNDLSSKEIAVS